jgi:fatty acid/phospholipid biosynthesis enzyme
MKIALDAMGHDEGPAPLIEGAALALREFRDISQLHLVGDTGESRRSCVASAAMTGALPSRTARKSSK